MGQRRCQAHPRMRGEDKSTIAHARLPNGSPPHARGRHKQSFQGDGDVRLTPACAGKTLTSTGRNWKPTAHPRMRGEDVSRPSPSRFTFGSPPHARGRLRPRQRRMALDRLTPACAGKTPGTNTAPPANPAHPRMRGEDGGIAVFGSGIDGSPPHARGRHGSLRRLVLRPRLTPACAGKTISLV